MLDLSLVAIGSSGRAGIFATIGFIASMMGWGLVIATVIGLLGLLLRRDAWAFLRTKADPVTMADVSALAMAVDQSLRQALDIVTADLRMTEAQDLFGQTYGTRILL